MTEIYMWVFVNNKREVPSNDDYHFIEAEDENEALKLIENYVKNEYKAYIEDEICDQLFLCYLKGKLKIELFRLEIKYRWILKPDKSFMIKEQTNGNSKRLEENVSKYEV